MTRLLEYSEFLRHILLRSALDLSFVCLTNLCGRISLATFQDTEPLVAPINPEAVEWYRKAGEQKQCNADIGSWLDVREGILRSPYRVPHEGASPT